MMGEHALRLSESGQGRVGWGARHKSGEKRYCGEETFLTSSS
jgi:hypothetical protein